MEENPYKAPVERGTKTEPWDQPLIWLLIVAGIATTVAYIAARIVLG